MNNQLLAAVSGAMLLTAVAASAQGLPPGTVPPQYGAQAWSVKQQAAIDRTSTPSDPQPATAPKTAFEKLPRPPIQRGG